MFETKEWYCPKCGMFIPWSNWGICPRCKEKTNV